MATPGEIIKTSGPQSFKVLLSDDDTCIVTRITFVSGTQEVTHRQEVSSEEQDYRETVSGGSGHTGPSIGAENVHEACTIADF